MHGFRYLTACAGLILALLPLRAAAESSELGRLDPILRQEVLRARRDPGYAPSAEFNPAVVAPHAGARGGSHEIACWIVREPGADWPEGFAVNPITEEIATARLRLDDVEALLRVPGLRQIQAAHRTEPKLDASVPEISADIVHGSSGSPPSYGGYSGNGVVIGVVDTGVDLDHADFESLGNTRIKWLWDQTAAAASPPAGYAYGTEWSEAQINGGSAVESDSDGHGTHVLGTAGGTGAATGNGEPAYQYVGVAPEATLIVVKTSFLTSAIVDAVEYVFDKADALGMPAVVNLSLGHHYGPHDGTELTDLAIDDLVGPGRIVVAAAGNEQEDAIHAERTLSSGTSDVITFDVPGYSPSTGASNDYIRIDGYYTNGQIVEVTLETPGGTLLGPVTPGNDDTYATAAGTVLIENDVYDPVTDDKNIFIQLWDQVSGSPPASGTWTIHLEHTGAARQGTSVANAQIDFWIYNHTISGDPTFADGMTASKLVGSPATADSVIAVAAYVTKKSWASVDGGNYSYSPAPLVGQLASFSSNGPRRDGVLKPDIAAPGMGIAAALSADAFVSDVWVVEDGQHMITQGTSMACPHVAGLLALMLEGDSDLSKKEALDLLSSTARADVFTSGVPNSGWGAGKIDALAATSSPTPVLLSGLSIERDEDGIHLSWSAPGATEDTIFRIERQTGGAAAVSVATVGPGPDYSFVDEPLLDFNEVVYWLVSIEFGHETARMGPFPAEWRGELPKFALSRPLPNPFSTRVQWTLSLPQAGPLRMDVIDVTGRVVRVLADEPLPAGSHTVVWDGDTESGADAASGVYWVRASWQDRRFTDRVLRLRNE